MRRPIHTWATAGATLILALGNACDARGRHEYADTAAADQSAAPAGANSATLEVVHRWALSDSLGQITALALDPNGNVHIGTSAGAIYRLDDRGIARTLREPERDTLAHAIVRALLVR